jgi:carbonic anhydrase
MAHDIQQLITGNKQFRKKYFGSDKTLFEELVSQGQRPKVMVIACSDSRVDPAMVFNCQPGQLFVVRNIANLIPPCETNDTYHGTSAALEFGTNFLEVEHIIVFGHTQCGGIRFLLENAQTMADAKQHSFIAKWIELARPAYNKIIAEHADKSINDQATLCTEYSLVNSLNNLSTFPWIKERVASGKLSLHAWYFDLATGGIHRYDQQNDRWLFE